MELDLFDILSKKEEGTRLYSPICGDLLLHNVSLNGVFCKQPGVKTEKNFVFMSDGHLKNYGEWADRGECLLFPNKEMRDWEKYCWKRGDVVINVGGGITAIFDGWENDSFTKFNTVYSYEAQDSSYNEDVIYNTADFRKENDGGRARFIANLEKEFNGKFNPDTLEVEEKSMFKNGDFVYSEWTETDADGKVKKRCSWVGIFKSGCEKCYKSHAVYFFEKGMLDFEDTYADAQKTSRLATDLEKVKLLSNLERNGMLTNFAWRIFLQSLTLTHSTKFSAEQVMMTDGEPTSSRISLTVWAKINYYMLVLMTVTTSAYPTQIMSTCLILNYLVRREVIND